MSIILIGVPGRYEPDPISEQMDAIAARLLRRAYRNRGQWAGTYLANPTREWDRWARRNGEGRLLGPDPVASGRARTRWARALIRSVYRMNQRYMTEHGLDLADDPRPQGLHPPFPLVYEVGNVRLGPGGRVIGRAVRIKFVEGGAAARKAVAAKPDKDRWIIDGRPGPAHSTYGEEQNP